MENKNELFKALASAQGSIIAAHKSQENPAFKREGKASTYADIADVIEVIQKPASDNGLSVFFNYKTDENGTFIQYRLNHSSGESFESDWVLMFLRDETAHGFGASNTFMRRQLLKAIYQIPEEDDDGNEASNKKPAEPKSPPKPPGSLSDAQIKRLFAIASSKKWSTEQVKSFMKTKWGYESTSQLNREQYDFLCKIIEAGEPQ